MKQHILVSHYLWSQYKIKLKLSNEILVTWPVAITDEVCWSWSLRTLAVYLSQPETNFRMVCFERGLAQDEHRHILMCRQIDQEPSQFPTSRTPKLPYSQGLPELSRTRYRPTPGPGKRSSRTLCKQWVRLMTHRAKVS